MSSAEHRVGSLLDRPLVMSDLAIDMDVPVSVVPRHDLSLSVRQSLLLC